MRDSADTHEDKAAYRAVILLRDDGVDRVVPLSADSDEEAIVLANALLGRHAIDLWDGLRFIEHFEVIGLDA